MKKNILLIILIIIITVIAVDYYRATQQKTPIFAVNFETKTDGDSKEYYGLGYKVIKYNIVGGRKDVVFGFITMKYDAESKNDKKPHCEFKMTYNVTKILPSNEEKILYLTLTQFQVEGATTIKYNKEKFGDLEEGSNYEFTFKTLNPNLKKSIEDVFNTSEMVSVEKTDKSGLDITEDKSCFKK
ncbi:MAG: hypothetical protein GX864_01100 [Mollicutes bacterium]|nr:hypothetical protein [Mollicutes bacterium]